MAIFLLAGLGAFAVALTRAPAPAAKAGLAFVLVCLLILSVLGVLFVGAAALVATNPEQAFVLLPVPGGLGLVSLLGLRWLLREPPSPPAKRRRRAPRKSPQK